MYTRLLCSYQSTNTLGFCRLTKLHNPDAQRENVYKRTITYGFGWKLVKAGYSFLISHDESEKRLPKSCLVLLCKYEPALRWSRDCDNTLYQGLVEILIPDVLRPIPSESAFKLSLVQYHAHLIVLYLY